jgi:hypothetical protein
MAGRADIEAGRAHIRLYMKDSEVVKGLNWLGGKLQGLGAGFMKFGGLVAGLGASIVAPFAAAVSTFMEFGGQLADMSARTGIAVGAIAELGFAANQTGANLEDVEAGTRRLSKTIAEAASGSKSAKEALAAVGLTAADLAGKLPEEQLALVGNRLTAIENPGQRAAATMEILGKSGTKLLPMLASLKALRTEAQRLGLAPTEGAVALADELGDAWDATQAVIKATIFEVGAALAPALLPAAKAITNIAASVNRWVRENGALIRTVAAVGAGLLVAGGVITAVGAGLFGLGIVLSGIATGLAALAAALSSPLTLVAALGAALVGAAVYWARFTESGRAAVQSLMSFFAPLVETARTTVAGIGDALMGGDLVLAGKIAMKGLQLIFQQGLAQLAELIGGTLGDTLGSIGTDLIQGDLASAWQTAIAGMAQLWAEFAEGVVAVFTQAARMVTEAWQSTVSGISDAILETSAGGGVLGKAASLVLGVDMAKEQERANKLNSQLGLTTTDVTKQAQADARSQIAGQAGFATGFLDRIDQAMQQQSDAAGQAFRDRVAGGAQKAKEAADRQAEELAALAEEARRAKEAAAAGDGLASPELAGVEGGSVGTAASFATFSAASLVAIGGGGIAQRQLDETRAMRKEQEKTNKLLADIGRQPLPGLRS